MPTIFRLLAKWLINSLALFAADYLVRGIVIYDFWSGLAAAALLVLLRELALRGEVQAAVHQIPGPGVHPVEAAQSLRQSLSVGAVEVTLLRHSS